MKPLGFEWDALKAAINAKKHGVTFEEASQVFGDPLAITISDIDHSEDEFREITIGSSDLNRLVVVSHTDRNGRIRIISARKADKSEVRAYHEG